MNSESHLCRSMLLFAWRFSSEGLLCRRDVDSEEFLDAET